MKIRYLKLIGMMLVSIMTLNSCSDLGIRSEPPVTYSAEAILKDINDSKYLNISNSYYKVKNEKIEALSENEYLAIEKDLVRNSNSDIEKDLEKIEQMIAKEYSIKIVSNDYDRKNKMLRERDGISVIALLDENFTFDTNNFLASYPYDSVNSLYKLLHIVKEDNSTFSIKKVLDVDYSVDIYADKKIQIENLPYVLLAGSKNRYIPLYNNGNIDFHAVNDFAKVFYSTSHDCKKYLQVHRSTVLALYANDGIVVVYDKTSSSDKDSKMVYKHIPFDSPNTPTVLDIDVRK